MATRMEDILAIVTANSDEAVDDFLVLTHPETSSKEELQETFEETLGYDPTSYFDYATLRVMLDNMKNNEDVPKDVIETIESEQEDIIKEAYDKFDSDRNIHLQEALDYAIEERTGFSLNNIENESDDEEYDEEE